jgi:hypothetical protein
MEKILLFFKPPSISWRVEEIGSEGSIHLGHGENEDVAAVARIVESLLALFDALIQDLNCFNHGNIRIGGFIRHCFDGLLNGVAEGV